MVDDALTQLFLQSRSGLQNDFEQVIKKSQHPAYLLAYRLLLDESDAKDMVQEAYIRAWQHRFNFDGRVKFTTWLYTIINNLCQDRRKAKTRRWRAFEIFHLWHSDRSSEDLEQGLEIKDTAQWISKLADELPARQQQIFVLRDLQDLDIPEISVITGQSIGAIKTNLYLARKYLRQRWNELQLQEQPHE